VAGEASHDLIAFFGCAPAVAAAFSDAARLQGMLDVEAALAEALVETGAIPADAAAHVREAARAELYDMRSLGEQASRAGNLAIPLIERLTARVAAADPAAARYVHWGATSQDIVDTGLVLQLSAALPHVLADLDRAAAAAANHARQHGDTVMAGRTWLQFATPVTFGLKAAGWLDGIVRARRALDESRQEALALQFGGASGTLAALGAEGPKVRRALAERLGLRATPIPWHADRGRLVRLACDLGTVVGTLGKIARDLSLLAQTEIGEAYDSPGSAGGSSTMPHKRNPVRAALVLAAAARVPGLVAGMLAAMPQEHERGLGGWQAEWDTLPEIVRLASVAAHSTAAALEELVVDAGRMRANLDAAGGLPMAEAIAFRLAPALGRAEAHAVVERAARRAADEKRAFGAVLSEDSAVTRVLSPAEISAALAPEQYLGSARHFVDAVLHEYDRGPRDRR
jgi:3-carboxy-cis,cis-muconate cycloisomerase